MLITFFIAEVCRNWRIQCYWDCVTRHIGPELSWAAAAEISARAWNLICWWKIKIELKQAKKLLGIHRILIVLCHNLAQKLWSNQACGLNPIGRIMGMAKLGPLWRWPEASNEGSSLMGSRAFRNSMRKYGKLLGALGALEPGMARWTLETLLGGLEHDVFFPIQLEMSCHPNWRTHSIIFQRGWLKPATRTSRLKLTRGKVIISPRMNQRVSSAGTKTSLFCGAVSVPRNFHPLGIGHVLPSGKLPRNYGKSPC